MPDFTGTTSNSEGTNLNALHACKVKRAEAGVGPILLVLAYAPSWALAHL